jgi:hypothetical protein
MKLEIISGTKDSPPMGYNTEIKIDGEKINHLINEFYFEVKHNEVANWGIKYNGKLNFTQKIKKFIYEIKRLFK